MKMTKLILRPLTSTLAAAVVAGLPIAHAEEGHDAGDQATHDHAVKKAGPNGGRVVTAVEPHFEFFVTEDRKVRVTVLDESGKAADPGDLSVKLTGGSRSNPTRMSFQKQDGSLVSDIAFPAGNDFPVVLQIKVSADAKSVIEKFNLNLNDCPNCRFKEYACACEHGEEGGDHQGHDH